MQFFVRLVKTFIQLVHITVSRSYVLISYPKSGSTVLRQRLLLMLSLVDDIGHYSINRASPEIGAMSNKVIGKLYKSHSIILGGILCRSQKIQLLRYPEEALISAYNYYVKTGANFSNYDDFLNSRYGLNRLEKHLHYAHRKSKTSHILIKYEVLVQEPVETLILLRKYLQLGQLSKEDLVEIVAKTTREKMSSSEKGTQNLNFSSEKKYPKPAVSTHNAVRIKELNLKYQSL